jgi:predicted nucleotidyltransferase
MNRFVATVSRACADLNAAAVPFALVGGLAVSARTEPRFTRDVDFAVAVDEDEKAEDVATFLTERGYSIRAIVEHEEKQRLATVRLVFTAMDHQAMAVDLLFASSGIEPEIVAEAEDIDVWGSISLPVAAIGHLIALKLLARDDQARPQDSIDLRALLAAADREEIERARRAAFLITKRGFNRGRSLCAQLERILQRE